jgi:nucleoid DNA-binding protein
MSDQVIKRADFIRDLVNSKGFTYAQASSAFDSMMKTLEDGICAGSKIQLAKIGAISPVKLDPRAVTMHFSKVGGEVKKQERTYHLGTRIKYRFKLFKGFVDRRTLNWKL